MLSIVVLIYTVNIAVLIVYGNALGLGYNPSINHRVRILNFATPWFICIFWVFNSVSAVECKAVLAVFSEKMLGKLENIAVRT